MSILQQIIETKKDEVIDLKQNHHDIIAQAKFANASQSSLAKSLTKHDDIAVIAEFKRTSPSLAPKVFNQDPIAQVRAYQDQGAAAISVLTDNKYFNGNFNDIKLIRPHTTLPILCKDFIVDPIQLVSAKAAGADAVLLITSILGHNLKSFIASAAGLGLEALVETHSHEDIKLAMLSGAKIIGINNRDLSTMTTKIDHSLRLRQHIGEGIITVSESGISEKSDLSQAKQAGFDAVLVGTKLMDGSTSINKLTGKDND